MNGRRTFIDYVRYTGIGAVLVLIVSSAVFLIYSLVLRHEPRSVASAYPETSAAPHDSTPFIPVVPETAEVRTESSVPESAMPASPLKLQPLHPGRQPASIPGLFTVYIAAYATEGPADDDVLRWNDAGYIASVIRTKHHFRVALGQYESTAEAKTFAEQMFEAFEYGYEIGRIE